MRKSLFPVGRMMVLALLVVVSTRLEAAATPAPDELIFVDGERLLGSLERSDNATVLFKSDIAGEIKAPWSKVKELHSSREFAIIPRGFECGRRHGDVQRIPQGRISVAAQTIAVKDGTANAQQFPVSSTGYIIDQDTFSKSLLRPGLFQDWQGAASAGVSLVLATQDDRTYTSGITLVRSIPTEPWMKPENRTIIDFSSSYGELTQPGQPLTKTSIFHADAERDEYFSQRLYTFLAAAFDHNFSQGLNLEQTFGGGVGWTALKDAHDELDLKGEATYVDQEFATASTNQNLFGSVFSEDYKRQFRRGIALTESLGISPAWTNQNAYSAEGNVLLAIPVLKRLSITVNTADTFLNDPSPGFRKNSFQFSTGLAYSVGQSK